MVTGDGAAKGVWQRPLYFDRQQLSASDLNSGPDYTRERLRWHNRYLHGWGIVCGLRVTRVSVDDLWTVRVSEGFLVTPLGDEAFVPEQTFDIRPGVEACLGDRRDCTDLDPSKGAPVRLVRACIDPPGRDLRSDYNVEWVDLCLLREVDLDGFSVQHTINPDTADEAIVTYFTFHEAGALPPGTVVRLHSGSRLDDTDPEPGLVHRYVAADTEKGNWRLNNSRERLRIRDAAGAVVDTRSFLPGSLLPVDAGVVYLVAGPAETPECPRPGVPADCLPPGSAYHYSRMREGHRLEVVCDRPSAYADQPACDDLERIVCEGAPAPCPAPVSEAGDCVVLARVQVLDDSVIMVDDLAERRQLVSASLVQQHAACRCDTRKPDAPPATAPPPSVFSAPTQPTEVTEPTRFPTPFTEFTLFSQFSRFTDLTLFTGLTRFSEPVPDPGFPIFTGRGPNLGFDPGTFDVERGRDRPVTDVEGIGRGRAERLGVLGVRNLLEFAAMSSEVAAEVLDVSEVRVAEMQDRARTLMRRPR